MEEMNCAFTDHAAQFFRCQGLRFSRPLPSGIHEKYTKNICRIYGRIQIHVAGNRLPGHATFFFTGTHKNYLALRKASYLRQRSGISCNNVNMSTHLYPLPRSRPNKSFYVPPPHPVRVTVNALAGGCQSLYSKIYGRFLRCKWFTGEIYLFALGLWEKVR